MRRSNIPVVILAGGFGTRLREQTEFIPKPMVPIGGRPILWHIMKTYSHYGFNKFIICLGYKGDVIKEYFFNYKIKNSDFTIKLSDTKLGFHSKNTEEDWEVTLADTGPRSMTGARVKKIEKYVDSDVFMLTYGDGVINADLSEILEFHLSHGKVATVTGVKPPSRFGELIVRENCVLDFSEKPQIGTGIINGGYFVLNKKFFDYLSADDSCTLEGKPLERLAMERNLMVHVHEDFWQCMDTVRDMTLLNEYWNGGNPPWKVWDDSHI